MTGQQVRREDGELVGWLLPADTSDGWVPATVFGAALAGPTDRAAAERVVREQGLSSLAEQWWVRRRVVAVGADGWRPAWLVEVEPDRLRLRWEHPMLMAGGTGEWVDLKDIQIRRDRP